MSLGRMKFLRRIACDECGQMTTELMLVIPVFLLALVMVVNVGMFVAEAARFDRVVNEVARALVTSVADPAARASVLLNEGLGYSGGVRGPFRAQVSVSAQDEPFFERRVLHFRLTYRLFATGAAPSASGKGLFSRSKTLVIPWSHGL
jgi:hypothetical protein